MIYSFTFHLQALNSVTRGKSKSFKIQHKESETQWHANDSCSMLNTFQLEFSHNYYLLLFDGCWVSITCITTIRKGVLARNLQNTTVFGLKKHLQKFGWWFLVSPQRLNWFGCSARWHQARAHQINYLGLTPMHYHMPWVPCLVFHQWKENHEIVTELTI